MEKPQRFIYNPFILKLLYVKLHYLDRLLVDYLPRVSRERHDALRQIILTNYHVDMVMCDVVRANLLAQRATYTIDVYLINFEYFLCRMTDSFVRVRQHQRESRFACEFLLTQTVETTGKQTLMRDLTVRYINKLYFDVKQRSQEKRLRDRVRLFFNIKQLVERELGPRFRPDEHTLRYDKSVVAGLHYIYFVNEFMSDRSHLFDKHKRNIVQFVNNAAATATTGGSIFMTGGDSIEAVMHVDEYQNVRDYVAGRTDVLDEKQLDSVYGCDPEQQQPPPPHQAGETNSEEKRLMDEYASDFVFLTQLRIKLIQWTVDHLWAWCVKDVYVNRVRPDILTRDPQDTAELRRLAHEHHYNQYTQLSAPSRQALPYTDALYSAFTGLDKDARLSEPVFLPLETNRKFYAAIAHEILFTVRLRARHSESRCGNDTDTDTMACALCRYVYLHQDVNHLCIQCQRHRYNTPTESLLDEGRDRQQLDHYLTHSVLELRTPFTGHLFRMLYNVTLLLYHTCIIMTSPDTEAEAATSGTVTVQRDVRYDLFRMVELNHMRQTVTQKKFERDIEAKLTNIIHHCRLISRTDSSSNSCSNSSGSGSNDSTSLPPLSLKEARNEELKRRNAELCQKLMASVAKVESVQRRSRRASHAIHVATTLTGNEEKEPLCASAATVTNGDEQQVDDYGDDDREIDSAEEEEDEAPVSLQPVSGIITSSSRLPVLPPPTRRLMQEKEAVRRLAFDMELLVQITVDIESQCETIKKYERSVATLVQPATYVLHSQMLLYMRKIYIYYTRQMHSLLLGRHD
jgi:hypothetical protein